MRTMQSTSAFTFDGTGDGQAPVFDPAERGLLGQRDRSRSRPGLHNTDLPV